VSVHKRRSSRLKVYKGNSRNREPFINSSPRNNIAERGGRLNAFTKDPRLTPSQTLSDIANRSSRHHSSNARTNSFFWDPPIEVPKKIGQGREKKEVQQTMTEIKQEQTTYDDWVEAYEQAINPTPDTKEQVRAALAQLLQQHPQLANPTTETKTPEVKP